ncbi:MAG TPA: endolytic transglycosylase MltG [Methylophilaceae bacterium]|nr:endolytic transglycosylase MltG [Methylophilaceae bacterium]HQR61150.1 endolytic transglycosylase MltG [Methylophilaceae bacterium]
MRLLRRLLVSGLFGLLLLAGGWLYHFASQPLELPRTPYDMVLKHGSSLRGIAQQLVSERVLKEPWSFMLLVRAMGKASEIKAGNYQLEQGITGFALFQMMTEGSTVQNSITFIEGWTFMQMREALNAHESVRHLSMPLTDAQIMEQIGATETMPEGLFFPDSYYFSSGMSDLDILKRAYQTMRQKLDLAWQGRDTGLPYATPYQALIMASIIEKETGRGGERPLIARVFLNRIKLGMRLQTDPTVIYGMGEAFDGNLRKRDLLRDTPYNTYTRDGLPPTPIAMPGQAAIEAALHPARGGALYFVGRGDGSHAFSNSLVEHNNAVARYQLRRRD